MALLSDAVSVLEGVIPGVDDLASLSKSMSMSDTDAIVLPITEVAMACAEVKMDEVTVPGSRREPAASTGGSLDSWTGIGSSSSLTVKSIRTGAVLGAGAVGETAIRLDVLAALKFSMAVLRDELIRLRFRGVSSSGQKVLRAEGFCLCFVCVGNTDIGVIALWGEQIRPTFFWGRRVEHSIARTWSRTLSTALPW